MTVILEYGRTVTQSELAADPVAILREAIESGAVTVVDELGLPCATIVGCAEEFDGDDAAVDPDGMVS